MIVLYTTHCPKCRVIEQKLKQKNIEFEMKEDTQEMIKLGFKFAPVLCVDGQYLDFMQANTWINKQGGNK